MKKIISMILIGLMAFGITGCGNEDATTAPKTETKVENSNEQLAHYPVTITTYDYAKNPVKVTFEKSPEKVIAVYQNSIETLLALGLQDKIIGVSGLDHDVKDEYKSEFSKLKHYEKTPTKEEVIGLEPDFILGWYSLFSEKKLGDVGFWHERGINTYMAQNSGVIKPDSLQNEYDDILNIGKIFNVENKANEIVNNMKKEIEKVKDLVKEKEAVKTVILEVEKDGVYRIYGEDSIGGDIAKGVGANLVAKSSGKMGNEDLIKLNPDVIFTVYYGKEIDKESALKSIMTNEGLSSISAIKSERVHPIMLSEVYASGIRTLDGIKTISKGLYPELYEDK
ncbi:ABC transporter substrate-binding protein [Clostridium gasigenes]|uniref:ABC transporter substrate-binding protein n=1 Tax=Clostridium gasigenes TaxID=94869 RepID=A0A1H0W3W7_9CLOT|nr:ABC transporter substrate-binding protein [Clostridium gasigenes]MBB6714561.1 ABC transporter substrate-binding protein [Clostridium gasigenes]SDP85440.1 iron complex transport system substrate-binding protein [Clostridium gasigenes]